MTRTADLGAVARAIIGSSLYMVLGTADERGQPWVSPVYYAPDGYTTFYWVSSPEAKHSRNVAARPEISIVVFDSGTPIGTGQGVYMSAVAEELTGADLEPAVGVFSRRSRAHGAEAWTPEDVRAPAAFRLYRAVASAQWVLEPGGPDHRTPVTLSSDDDT